MYFVVEAIQRLGTFTLYNQDNILITQEISDDLVIILYNPQYIDPLMSTDSRYLNQLKRQLFITLKGLETGKYQIKKYTYDDGHSGIHNHLAHIGFPKDLLDKDVIDVCATMPFAELLSIGITVDYLQKIKFKYQEVKTKDITNNG